MKNRTKQASRKPAPTPPAPPPKFSRPITGEQDIEYTAFDELSFGGKIGPWSERFVAIYRTLEALAFAADALMELDEVPELRDGVAESHLQKLIAECTQHARQMLPRLIMLEPPEGIPAKAVKHV